jgi:hypothetical protein
LIISLTLLYKMNKVKGVIASVTGNRPQNDGLTGTGGGGGIAPLGAGAGGADQQHGTSTGVGTTTGPLGTGVGTGVAGGTGYGNTGTGQGIAGKIENALEGGQGNGDVGFAGNTAGIGYVVAPTK